MLATLAFYALTVQAQTIPAAGLQADAAILKQAFEALHPGLYRYNPKPQIDRDFEDLNRTFNKDLPLGEAYKQFAILTAKIECGHTHPNPFNQSDATQIALFDQPNLIPLEFRWLGGKMIVTENLSKAPEITPGTEVVRINGVQARKVLDTLLQVARSDGSNDAKRVALMEVQGRSKFEEFDVYYPLFFPVSGQFELQIKNVEGTKTVSVPPIDRRARLARIAEKEKAAGAAAQWTFKNLAPNIAYLQMPTWSLYNDKWDWKAFLAKTFDQLSGAQTKNLIIDLRGNEGGSDVGPTLISYLIKDTIRLPEYTRQVRYQKVPDELSKYLSTWDPSFKDWSDQVTVSKDGFYLLNRPGDSVADNLIKPVENPYRGKTILLIDANNSSATFQFVNAFHANALGLLVGSPTGGNLKGINGGAFFFLKLPNSGIEVDIPLIGYFPGSKQPDQGIDPDVPVMETAADIAKGTDTVLEVAKKLCVQ